MAINNRVEFCELLVSRLIWHIIIPEVFSRLKLRKTTEEWEGPREGRGRGKEEKEGREKEQKEGRKGGKVCVLPLT